MDYGEKYKKILKWIDKFYIFGLNLILLSLGKSLNRSLIQTQPKNPAYVIIIQVIYLQSRFHYENSPTIAVMEICPKHFSRFTFYRNFMLTKKIISSKQLLERRNNTTEWIKIRLENAAFSLREATLYILCRSLVLYGQPNKQKKRQLFTMITMTLMHT